MNKPDRPSVPVAAAAPRHQATRAALADEMQFEILRLLAEDPTRSQRQVANALGISVGSSHHALKALLNKGWIKMKNFHASPDKRRYLYQLTPVGIANKTRIAAEFLARKRAEHARLLVEIERLRAEVDNDRARSGQDGING